MIEVNGSKVRPDTGDIHIICKGRCHTQVNAVPDDDKMNMYSSILFCYLQCTSTIIGNIVADFRIIRFGHRSSFV